jgi:hypothetical protein
MNVFITLLIKQKELQNLMLETPSSLPVAPHRQNAGKKDRLDSRKERRIVLSMPQETHSLARNVHTYFPGSLPELSPTSET